MTAPTAPERRTTGGLLAAEDRPTPHPWSLGGFVAGSLIVASLAAFLAEIGNDLRGPGIALSLAYLIGGVGLLLLARSTRSVTAGVTVAATVAVPLFIFLFFNVDKPESVDTPSKFTNTTSLVLICLIVLWLIAYFVPPSRRFGIFLGLALAAIWMLAVVQIVDDPLNQVVDRVEQTGYPVDPYGSPSDYPTSDPGFDDSGFGGSDARYPGEIENPATKVGVASLLLGGLYCALAFWRDRRGDRRQATPLVAVGAPLLTLAPLLLSDTFGDEGTSVILTLIGGLLVWLGTRSGRRFTSWWGAAVVALGLLTFIGQLFEKSARVLGVAFLALGLAIAVGLFFLERRGTGRSRTAPAGPGGPTEPGAATTYPASPPMAPDSAAGQPGWNQPGPGPNQPWQQPGSGF